MNDLICERLVQSPIISVGLLWINFGGLYIILELHLIHFYFVKDYLVF